MKKAQLFVNKRSGQCINVKVVIRLEEETIEEMFEIFDELWTLEDLERRGWQKVDKDPGYRGMPAHKV